ncbi:MAG TPA: DUF6232 family protein [Roseiflexaceae bacterium]|nr:DUF6232 family protein [Roseiflexaceae bacterium]
MEATNERVIYRSGNTVVTDTRANVSGQSYDLSNVAGVSLVTPNIPRWLGGVLIAVGVILLIVGYIVWEGVFLTPMLGGGVLIIAGAAVYALVRERYTVTITDKDGGQQQVQFTDGRQAQQLVEAISGAIRNKR